MIGGTWECSNQEFDTSVARPRVVFGNGKKPVQLTITWYNENTIYYKTYSIYYTIYGGPSISLKIVYLTTYIYVQVD